LLAAGLIVGVLVFAIYYAATQRTQKSGLRLRKHQLVSRPRLRNHASAISIAFACCLTVTVSNTDA
jgi:hypothetical protein